MKMKTKILTFGLLALSLVCGGCKSVLIPEDKPLVLDQRSWLSSASQNDIEILAYEAIGTGSVQDISYDGSTLLILNPTQTTPVSYNVDLLRFTEEGNRLTSFLSSEKSQVAAAFDPYAQGIFYVEETDAENSPVAKQLVWTSIDKSTTRTISSQEESVNAAFYTISDSQVLYTDSSRSLIFADANGRHEVYSTTYNLDIQQVAYLPESQTVLYTAKSPSDENKTNLYRSELKAGETVLTSALIDENVLDFDLNADSGLLFYIKLNGSSREMMRCNVNNYSTPTAIAKGNFTSVTATASGDQVLFSEYSSTNSKSSQSIWIMDSNGKNQLQITAPLTLTSEIIAHPYKSTIYFSAEKSPGDEDLSPDKGGGKGGTPTVFKIDYNIK
ncbi:MAG: hypothetical protein Q4C55_09200 [Eubacterium sp.]|nr:hypothetical protein [Eubacterium sp.]